MFPVPSPNIIDTAGTIKRGEEKKNAGRLGDIAVDVVDKIEVKVKEKSISFHFSRSVLMIKALPDGKSPVRG